MTFSLQHVGSAAPRGPRRVDSAGTEPYDEGIRNDAV